MGDMVNRYFGKYLNLTSEEMLDRLLKVVGDAEQEILDDPLGQYQKVSARSKKFQNHVRDIHEAATVQFQMVEPGSPIMPSFVQIPTAEYEAFLRIQRVLEKGKAEGLHF